MLSVAFLLSVALSNLGAAERIYSENGFSIRVRYNETARPGDAVFVRLDVTAPELKSGSGDSARLTLYVNGSPSRKADFYSLEKAGSPSSMLAGIPLSTWWTPEVSFHLNVSYRPAGKSGFGFDLPFKLSAKKFNSETIVLNQANTEIRTNTSTEKQKQSANLYEIISTKNMSSVFQAAPFTAPTDSKRFTSYFGDRRVFVYSTGSKATSEHYGNDYGIPTGTSVSACASGKVVFADWRISTGYSVIIEHLPGLYSIYYHLSELKCKAGQTVNAGDLIAKSGATGLATGPHLHWEMRLNGEAVDPLFFLKDFAFTE
ncbi:MAG: M23 family metallopeptidase [Treponema sp.]|nr:M23 family metallopeptidase [Treponema sp.]